MCFTQCGSVQSPVQPGFRAAKSAPISPHHTCHRLMDSSHSLMLGFLQEKMPNAKGPGKAEELAVILNLITLGPFQVTFSHIEWDIM